MRWTLLLLIVCVVIGCQGRGTPAAPDSPTPSEPTERSDSGSGPLPPPEVLEVRTRGEICAGCWPTFEAVGNYSLAAWEWDFGGAAGLRMPAYSLAPVIMPDVGEYTASVVGISATGERSAPYQFQLSVPDLPPRVTAVVQSRPVAVGEDLELQAILTKPSTRQLAWKVKRDPVTYRSDPFLSIKTKYPGVRRGRVQLGGSTSANWYPFTYIVSGPAAIAATSMHDSVAESGDQIQAISEAYGFDLKLAWDFGEGATPRVSTERHPFVTLGAPGVYTGALEVVDRDFNRARHEFTYTVAHRWSSYRVPARDGNFVTSVMNGKPLVLIGNNAGADLFVATVALPGSAAEWDRRSVVGDEPCRPRDLVLLSDGRLAANVNMKVTNPTTGETDWRSDLLVSLDSAPQAPADWIRVAGPGLGAWTTAWEGSHFWQIRRQVEADLLPHDYLSSVDLANPTAPEWAIVELAAGVFRPNTELLVGEGVVHLLTAHPGIRWSSHRLPIPALATDWTSQQIVPEPIHQLCIATAGDKWYCGGTYLHPDAVQRGVILAGTSSELALGRDWTRFETDSDLAGYWMPGPGENQLSIVEGLSVSSFGIRAWELTRVSLVSSPGPVPRIVEAFGRDDLHDLRYPAALQGAGAGLPLIASIDEEAGDLVVFQAAAN